MCLVCKLVKVWVYDWGSVCEVVFKGVSFVEIFKYSKVDI